MSGLSTSLSGLLAAQRALETTQNNISNINTDGYSRQRVELGTRTAQFTGEGYIGQGVNVTNISRSYDQFVNKQLSASTSAFNETDRYQQLTASVDNLLGDSTTGMAPALNNFFKAFSGVSSDPSAIPARQVLLANADMVAQTFNTLGNRLENMRSQNNTDIGGKIDTINSIAVSIADLNSQISANLGKTQGLKQPNDLLDQQDALLSKLSEIINVSIVPQKDGSSSVFIGNGQPLVLNNRATTFVTLQNQLDPGKLLVGVQTATETIDITNQISGGSLGGALRFRDEVLDPAQQKLGQLAVGLSMELNAVHQKGFDLNGVAGTALFSFAGSGIPVTPNSKNIGNAAVTASFQDVNVNPSATANLDYSDYKLTYVNAGGGVDYTLTRLRDNQVVNLTATTVAGVSTLSYAATQPANTTIKALPGINIKVDTSGGQTPLAVGDVSLIRPTYSAALTIGVNITDPKKVAAATNIEVDPVTNLPVQKLDALNNPVVDAQGNPVYVTINGPMPGDNRNALLLASLKDKLSMSGGSSSFNDVYGQIVAGVGTLAQSAKLNSAAQQTMLNQAKGARESLAGVNLDEEAANLIKFQQAYQAAAQSVSVARSLFDSLLGAVK